MRAAAATDSRTGWWRFLFALFGFVAFGYVPVGNAFAPIGPAFFLVAATAIACLLVAVARGGRPSMPLLLIAAGGSFLMGGMGGAAAPYRYLVIGWTLLLGASFGIVCLVSAAQPFLSRALATLALAFIVGLAGAATFGSGFERVRATLYTEATRRADLLDLAGQRRFAGVRWRDLEAQQPRLASIRTGYEAWVHALPARTIFLFPALLALQSLAALALGWELFHRLSRDRIGASIGSLRDFRFNDQLVWAVAVGVTLVVLPQFAEGRAAGVNILLVFGALFALRGLGVLASRPRGGAFVALVLLLVLVAWPLPAGLTVLLGVIALLGLADVWLDLRRRAGAVK